MGTEVRGREKRIRHSCKQGCKKVFVFILLQDVGVFGSSAVESF